MFMRCRTCVPLAILAALTLFTGLAALRPLVAAEPWPAVGGEPSAAELKIHSALRKETRYDFVETPLDQVVQFLKEAHDIPIELDRRTMDEVGIGTDTPITRTVKGISLESALRLLLRDLELDFIVQDEVLLITSEQVIQKSRSRSAVCVYKTEGLLSDGETPETLAAALMKLLDSAPVPAAPIINMPGMMGMPGTPGASPPAGMGMVPGMAPGMAPDMAPGMRAAPAAPAAPAKEPLRIVPFHDLLIVRATVGQQEELSRVLGALAEARTGGPKRPAPPPPRLPPSPAPKR